LATGTPTRKAASPRTTQRKAAIGRAPAAASREGPIGRRSSRARNLVIVESPAKARTVESILGPGYRVIASVGHVRDLPPVGYGGMAPDDGNFEPTYVVDRDKRQIVGEIEDSARSADRVYLSTDPDREGEAISWHILEAAKIDPGKVDRVVFHEITPPAIQEAFAHPRKLDMNLVSAQQARRVLDRLIGYPLSWFVQDKVTRSASAGRVQSVALRLVVEREREILDFKAQEYWTIHALLAKDGSAFPAELVRLPGAGRSTLKPGSGPFLPAIPDATAADRLVRTFEGSAFTVATVKKGERSKSPLPPFTTSTFQQAANNRLGIGASRAMALAQQLYEGVSLPGEGPVGLITYMRTDSLNVSPVARGDARRYIAGRWGPDYVPARERVYRTKQKGAQEAHEAIRPTNPARTPQSLARALDANQLRVYTLIWQRFMASQMADARYATVSVDIDARSSDELRGVFRSSTQQLLFAGHLAVYGADANDRRAEDDDDDPEGTLPELAAGDPLERKSIEPRQHFTEPPPRYTEASLVKALEEKGIGRPSTYASILQTVMKREYVSKQGRSLVPQELGFIVNDLLVEHMDDYVAVPFTGEMEEELDEVADGDRDYHSVVSNFWPKFKERLDRAKQSADKAQEETDILCDLCGQAKLVVKWGRNGKFLACPRYPECKNARPLTQEGEPAPVVRPEAIDYHCPKCGSQLVKKNGPFGPYVDCPRRETKECDFRAGVPVGVPCPEEPESGQLVEKRTRRGTFYGCWNYPNCSYTTNSLEPGKMSPARSPAEREAANAKLRERSARGKAAFASRRSRAAGARRAS
jgi:DNA topoisomerase-1